MTVIENLYKTVNHTMKTKRDNILYFIIYNGFCYVVLTVRHALTKLFRADHRHGDTKKASLTYTTVLYIDIVLSRQELNMHCLSN